MLAPVGTEPQACPVCKSLRTERMVALSAADPEYDFMRCLDCPYTWVTPKKEERRTS